MDTRDKLFFESLSKGTVGIFDKNPTTADIILRLPSFIIGVGAIGVRMIMRKRQGYLEFWDILKLIMHLIIILILCYPGWFFGMKIKEQWDGAKTSLFLYLGVILLSTIYHYFIDFRYPRTGLENKDQYRGKNILGKPEIDEKRDMKLRLYDSLFITIAGLSLVLKPTMVLLGIVLLISAGCLLIEDLIFNNHVQSLRRKWIGNEEFAKLIAEMKEDKESKQSNDNEFFNPRITN